VRARRPEHPAITFRSMLEGQWSAVLDELGLTWEYEPVRFDLPSGLYVPDFRVTTRDGITFWIEVKGPWPNAREFEVATEVNLYSGLPLLILTGDVPRQANGGTAWWFGQRQWSMLRPEEALIRLMWPEPEHRPERLAGWTEALDVGRHTELIKIGADT
jgi:hypothetical protein